MNKIENFRAVADKVSAKGRVEYELWVDDGGLLYVQLVGNNASGTFSGHAFSVSDYAHLRNSSAALGKMAAKSTENGHTLQVEDKNNGAFLKAALRHLIDGKS